MAACLESAPDLVRVWEPTADRGLTSRTTVRMMRVTPDAEAEAVPRQWGMRQNETIFQNIAAPPRTNRPGLATNQVSHIVSGLSLTVSEVSLLCPGSVSPVVTLDPLESRDRREASSPPLWIPAFAGMTVVKRSRRGIGGGWQAWVTVTRGGRLSGGPACPGSRRSWRPGTPLG